MRIRLLVCALLAASSLAAQSRPVGATPPMGWNSWDAYGLTITEEQFRANVHVLATALKPYGWQYAVIDEGWFMVNPTDSPKPSTSGMLIDAYGRYIPATTRFPSAAGDHGFEQLGKDVHAAGLKFGIHIVRGIPRMAVLANTPVEGSTFHAVDVADQTDACSWDPTNWGVRDTPAGQAYYDSLLRQFAGWGVDLLKVDCISDHPYKIDEIRMIRRAIDKVGRPIVLSLSPGPTNLSHAAEVASLAQMWRISDDIWDVWKSEKPWPMSVESQFARVAAWEKYAKPGNWPDADMLPFGELRPNPGSGKTRSSHLTPDEEKTQITLWSMARSPLILGANLTLLDAYTTTLLVNRDLIRIDQTATASREALREGDLIAWTADLPMRERALALFNTGDQPMTLDVDFAKYGLGKQKYLARNVWEGTTQGRVSELHSVVIPPHACVLWMLRQGPGEDLLGE
jgi:alpha-galactosidase